jgi:uncharacterized protein
MSIFGDLNVRLDPWDVDYGSEFPLASVDDGGAEDVELDIETPPERWEPIVPEPLRIDRALHFVDGVRRIEARLLIRTADRLCHGALGSYGVGSVYVSSGSAECQTIRVGRIAAVGSGLILPRSVAVAPELVYEPVSWPEPDVDGPLRAIQKTMRDGEEQLARELADDPNAMVIADGPLSFEHAVRGNALGYIKRVFKLYLPAIHLGLLARLPVGGRTPLFELTKMKRNRYSWFQRIAGTHPGDSDLTGIVRMEVARDVGKDAAVRLANEAAQLLPRFVPSRGRDPRSPQNLLPIGALEAQLRRYLGDARLARRRIQTIIAREAAANV